MVILIGFGCYLIYTCLCLCQFKPFTNISLFRVCQIQVFGSSYYRACTVFQYVSLVSMERSSSKRNICYWRVSTRYNHWDCHVSLDCWQKQQFSITCERISGFQWMLPSVTWRHFLHFARYSSQTVINGYNCPICYI